MPKAAEQRGLGSSQPAATAPIGMASAAAPRNPSGPSATRRRTSRPMRPRRGASSAATPRPGVLTSADRIALECLACLTAKGRRPEGLRPAELGHLRALLGEFGASPASRSRVLPVGAAEAPAGGNPWDVPMPRA